MEFDWCQSRCLLLLTKGEGGYLRLDNSEDVSNLPLLCVNLGIDKSINQLFRNVTSLS